MHKTVEAPVTSQEELAQIKAKEEIRAKLQSKQVFFATPAYGGWVGVNFINSLLATVNMFRDIGIIHAVAFKYNESLITRARNELVHDFLLTYPSYTDFFFIDADIGFDPYDIVKFLLHDEQEIIGSPCVRKSLNWKRIIQAGSKNGDLQNDEYVKLGAEFVINFDPSTQPKEIRLDQLIEVQDVGTGLMRVTRKAFEKIKEAVPDRYYWPMGGEMPVDQPIYMFFQSGLDEESKVHNVGGLPHYIPEDFAFCRLAKQAGLKIWIAPWMHTSHMGSFIFQGSMPIVAKLGGSVR